MKAQSELLTEFYRAYLAWVEAGAIENEPFKRYFGLCSNFHVFMFEVKRFDSVNAALVIESVSEEMTASFSDSGLNIYYPFNNGKEYSYLGEAVKNKSHTNKKRLQWVRDHANFED